MLSQKFVDRYANTQTPFYNHGLGEFVYMRTYSRIKENGKNELWHETIERVVNGLFKIKEKHYQQNNLSWDINIESKHAEKMYDLLFNIKFLPGGRSLWAMGTKITDEKELYAALNNCANITTANIDSEYSKPFEFLFDACMLGVGVGFDTDGANKIIINKPLNESKIYFIEDSREGWVKGLRKLLNQYFKVNKKTIILDYSKIRPAGQLLKTFGGTSSGSEPLKNSFTQINNLLLNNINKKISSKVIVDIMNMLCLCVISGNVRRSASIAVGKHDDKEFINLKNYELNPERVGYGWLSNNSIRAPIGMDYKDIGSNIALNGEPGILWLDNMREYSRVNGIKDYRDMKVTAANPCFTKDTYLLTDRGNITFEEILDNVILRNNLASHSPEKHKYSYINVWNGFEYTPAKIQYHGKSQIQKIIFSNGISLNCTPNHKFFVNNNIETEAKDLKVGDIIYYNNYKYCNNSGLKNSNMMNQERHYHFRDNIFNEFKLSEKYIDDEVNFKNSYDKATCKKILFLTEFLKDIDTLIKQTPNKLIIEYNNKFGEFEDIYYYLLSLGIMINLVRKEDNKVIIKIYGKFAYQLNKLLNLYSDYSLKGEINKDFNKKIKIIKIELLENEEDVYCVDTLNATHKATFNGIIASNCSEISLESGELCNLVEVFINRHNSYDDFKETLQYAFMYGKIVSLCKTHWEETNNIIERNRRVGCSLTGIVNFIEDKGIETLRQWTNRGYEYLKEFDKKISNELNINESIKITCIKPSGTISLLVPNTCPGVHYPTSRYYIRRIRINDTSTKLINSMGRKGYIIEDSETEPNTKIINFPIDNKCNRTINDVTMWEQLELAAKMQEWWADNQVSCTVTFDINSEKDDIEYALNLYQYKLKGISFLPIDKNNHQSAYPQMPYEKIDENKYNELIGKVKINEIMEIDSNAQEEEMFCTTDMCMLKKNMQKKNIIFMNGVAGSGKSYLADKIKKHLLSNNIKTCIISKDTYRYVNNEYIFTKEYEKVVSEKYFNKLNKVLNNPKYKYIILDNTHISNNFINDTLQHIKDKDNCMMICIEPYSTIEKHLNKNMHIKEIEPINRQIRDWNMNKDLYMLPKSVNKKINDEYFSNDEIAKIINDIILFFR